MARFHINPNTGTPGVCRAAVACPFGDLQNDHFDSAEAARAAYETKAEAEFSTVGSLSRAAATPAPARLFASAGAKDLVGSLVGKDYASVISNARDRASLANDYFAGKAKPAGAAIDFDRHTEVASASVANDARAALSARRSSIGSNTPSRIGMVTEASTTTASDAQAALAARRVSGNTFLAGSRNMVAAS